MSNGAGSLDLRGERVRIRWWQSQDDIKQRSWPSYSDPLSSLWNIPRNFSLYSGLFSMTSIAPGDTRRVWAIETSMGELVGRISLREIDRRIGQARLGISLGAPYVGHGMGSEALAVFLDYFFYTLDFRKMVLDVAAFNRRAVRCYEQLGFCCVGDEWRKTSSDAGAHLLEDPAYADLLPYFHRERLGIRVQYLEMELDRDVWLQRSTQHRQPAASVH